MKSYQLPVSILILFLLLWLPLGQYDFMFDHWMKVGSFSGLFLLIGFLVANEKGSTLDKIDFRFIGIVMLLAYIVHQFEEHWIDVYGNNYAFYTYNNDLLRGALGIENTDIYPLTKASVYVINTALVWLVGFLAIWRAPKHFFPLSAMGAIIMINGVVHIMAMIISGAYNPGLLTSVIVFIPVYIAFVRLILNSYVHLNGQLVLGLVWGFLAHVIMVGGLIIANYLHFISEPVYFGALVVWSVLPILVFKRPIPRGNA
ncbi:MAG: HXXEE domain-containing protein [Bacteroidota bacterium]